MTASLDLCFQTATELAARIRRREVSAREVIEAHLAQIERVNPAVNAICTLVADRAMEQARQADEALTHGATPGPLFGLPIAIKDLEEAAGIRTTRGSPIYAEAIPARDALFVQRLKAAGAIVIGKTNVPEFGAGSHTFNPVFGLTRNPYDLSRSAGGSSGGGAAALACGMLPIADGSDLGGSVRNPPNFNNVVGLRPSPGRIPRYPTEEPWNSMAVLGPMARTVQDAALLLSTMAGPDTRDPLSIPGPPEVFRGPLTRDFRGCRIAWSRDLGQFPVESIVVEAIERALPVFADLGCVLEEAHPDFSGAAEAFHVLRAAGFAFTMRREYAHHRHLLKDTIVWNIEQGMRLTALNVARAEAERGALFQRMSTFLQHYDFLLLPVSQVAPFPAEIEWVREIEGMPMETYIDWMKSCSFITLTSCPAASVPCGFTPEGLPVGVQIVGRYRREIEVLQLAHAFEQARQSGRFTFPKLAVT
ncbi:MAG: amidase [Anaerolineales bacterium]|nr:amidase [Anaerolineales bacterium]